MGLVAPSLRSPSPVFIIAKQIPKVQTALINLGMSEGIYYLWEADGYGLSLLYLYFTSIYLHIPVFNIHLNYIKKLIKIIESI